MANTNAQGKVPNVAQHGFASFRTDMFGRIKVSEPYTLFDSTHRYERSADYSEELTGGGTVTYLANESSLSLNVGTASGDKVTLESYKVFPYQPGKSLQVLQTFVFAPAKANLRQRVGYFSRQNGFYLEQDGSAVYLVKRSYISGAVVETRVPQSEWNIDQLNGDGPSDIVLDLSKAQILFSEYEWLGVGSVRMGFAIDGYFIPVHIFNHANHISSVYITTASLPVRYEIENTGATTSASSFRQVCTSIVSNGGYSHDESEIYTAIRETEVTVGTTRYPLVAIRMKSGRTDSVIIPTIVDIASGTAGTGIWELVKNPTTLNGGSWSTTDSSKNVEYSINMTTITGGTVARRRMFSTSNQSAAEASSEDLATWDLQLGRTNSDTSVSDIYVLTFRTFKNTMVMQGMLAWHDLL
jgi:hypothetical protein